jgi:hypothetical protein
VRPAGRRQSRRWIRAGDLAVRRDDLGQGIEGYAEQVAELRTPLTGANVEEQRARRIGRIGDMVQTACHAGNEVGVDRADRDAT